MNARINESDLLRVPPYSREAESSVIGALLLDNSAWDRCGDVVKESDFFEHANRQIFSTISALLSAGKPADLMTVYERLEAAGKVDETGGLPYLNALSQYVPSAANLRRYAEIVKEKSRTRALLGTCQNIEILAYDDTTSIEDRIDSAMSEIGRLVSEAPRDEWVSAYEGMTMHTQTLEERAEGKQTAMPTGLMDLDEFLEGGLRPGELVIVGARPSMGKTALGLTIGVHMATRYSVGLLSMEMSHGEVNDRLTAMLGMVSLSSVKRPSRGEGLAWDRVMNGVQRAKRLKLHTSDHGGLNINQVRSKARNLKRLHGLDVLVVDYIGLMTGLDGKQNRNTQLEEISRGLKTLAKELGISVLCLAQLNRKAEERADQMPMMSDLRDSGAIEQDADVIIFIKRPIMANPDLGEQWKQYAKLSVAKNRQGRCGYLHLAYIGENTRFTEWSGEAPNGGGTVKTAHRGGMQ